MTSVQHDMKDSSSLEHNEDASFGSTKHRAGEPVIEAVTYGYTGAKSWLSSPYVLGASLLASMGGFSYGYGMPDDSL